LEPFTASPERVGWHRRSFESFEQLALDHRAGTELELSVPTSCGTDSGMREGRFRGGVIVLLGISVAACGGDGDTVTAVPTLAATPAPIPATEPTPTPAPRAAEDDGVVAPERGATIGGEPATVVAAGMAYAFTPTVRGPDGHRLTFSILNAPTWATFDRRTGRLSGTPRAEHVGTAFGIVISAHAGDLSTSLAAFDLTVVALATGSATLTWLPPTTNTDGSPLTNLSGYRVYWGTARGDYPNSVVLGNPGLTTYVVENLAPATYYFAMTSLSAAGSESTLSAAATKRVQ
jgi:hypothetical protein